VQVSLIKKDGETWNRFRVVTKQVPGYAVLLKKYHVDIEKPYRQSKLYSYFETKGDLLNEK